jgi:hypothetical protein
MAIKCRDTYTSDDLEYKSIINTANHSTKQLKKRRNEKGVPPSEKLMIKEKLHTLMILKWIAAKRFGVDSKTISNTIKSYYRSRHIRRMHELFFLKHYKYGNDLRKYQQDFKEEFNYDMEII